MRQTVIEVKNVSKIYELYDSPMQRFKEAINPFARKRHQDFYALRDISFTVNRGETISILGKNGSGKSTLLKIITGVLTPSSGTVEVQGKIAALLELGAGFNPELTGMENIFLSGLIMGYSKDQMEARLDAIVSFADIGEYINQPVKMYSSGMFARLAFAVSTNADPDIFIIDEALSVGDMFFQAKCMTQLRKMVEAGTTVLFVSHDLSAIKGLCQKAIWLKNGSIERMGSAPEVVHEYSVELVNNFNTINGSHKKQHTGTVVSETGWDVSEDAFDNDPQFFRTGTFGAKFRKVEVLDEDGHSLPNIVSFGQKITLKCYIEILEPCQYLNICYHVKNKHGQEVVGDATLLAENAIYEKEWKRGDRLIVSFVTELPILHGIYNLNVLVTKMQDIAKCTDVVFLDCLENAFVFEMQPKEPTRLWDFVYLKNEVHYQIIHS